MDIDQQILLLEEIVVALLFVAVLVGIAAHRLRVPYTVGLVLMGLVMTFWEQVDLSIPPNLILAFLVPPLIFEAAFHLNLADLRRNLVPILALAIPGVVLTTLIVGGIVAWGTGLPVAVAIVFGALVSATDPVSVVALFRQMGVPKRLQVLLEGESLLNDGTAIVVFDLVLILAASQVAQFNLGISLMEFIRVSGGGVLIGLILGSLVSQLISRIDDHLIETALTAVLAFGAYLIAELVGVSGVLAVVAAGLINGNIGPRGMSPTTKIVVYNFWEIAGFLANSFIFLLIGLQIHLQVLSKNWTSIFWAIIGILVARAISVYALNWVGREIPRRWQIVLFWGGLRGAISLALALSLPEALPQYSGQLQSMAFGVVLFTLLVQGFSMKPLVSRLGVSQRKESQDEYERRHARAVASRTAYDHLKRQHSHGLISDHTWQMISPLLQAHNRSLANAVRDAISDDPHVEKEELDTARREYLRAQRSAINSLRRDGTVTDEIYQQLIQEIDAAITNPRATWPEVFTHRGADLRVNRLMAVVIQEQDVENTLSAMTKLGVVATRLRSTGGYFGHPNVTFLIGLEQGQEQMVVKALEKSCHKRVEYLTSPVEGFPSGLAEPIPVTIGGATMFTFEVERFEIL